VDAMIKTKRNFGIWTSLTKGNWIVDP